MRQSVLLFFGSAILVAALSILLTACDGGLSPPTDVRVGTIEGTITYVGDWPLPSEFVDIRFVALRFVPQDTTDFLQLNRMVVSDPLTYGVRSESFVIRDVEEGLFPFSGVARQRTQDIFSWGPIGLYTENDGVFRIEANEVVQIDVVVDFANPPPFPKTAVIGID